jgi:hypothetical protein
LSVNEVILNNNNEIVEILTKVEVTMFEENLRVIGDRKSSLF